jgi:hypothetical protein
MLVQECWASSPGQGRINVLTQCRADLIMDDVGFPWDWYPILQDRCGELILPSSPKGNMTFDLHVLTTEEHSQTVFEWIVLHMDRLYSNGSSVFEWKALCSSPLISYALLNRLSKRVLSKLDWTVLTKRANFLEPRNSLLGVQFVVDNLHLNWL